MNISPISVRTGKFKLFIWKRNVQQEHQTGAYSNPSSITGASVPPPSLLLLPHVNIHMASCAEADPGSCSPTPSTNKGWRSPEKKQLRSVSHWQERQDENLRLLHPILGFTEKKKLEAAGKQVGQGVRQDT